MPIAFAEEMTIQIRKSHPLLSIVDARLISLPTPAGITTIWNFGSLLGLSIFIQVITGLILAMQYTRGTEAFYRVVRLSVDTPYGWVIRFIHANGASIVFLGLYLHIGRGIYYGRYVNSHVWLRGLALLLLIIATAFLGYVLPWGQISLWGATVITNLLSAIPYIGSDLVVWIWGGYSVRETTLTRFFALHFITPLLRIVLIIIHLIFLHEKGSRNLLGLNSNVDKIRFHPYFSVKDVIGVVLFTLLWGLLCLIHPWGLGDVENFIEANSLVTPLHIKPEWYFLFAYAILRAVPNKLGGVVGLVLSIVLWRLAATPKPFYSISRNTNPIKKIIFWSLVRVFVVLTWLGGQPVEDPFIGLRQIFSVIYFSLVRWICMIN